ncbi:tRNA glutamyl-Q(34) synthetase GluQRS [Sphingopyxis bauzanensis]|uniref:tRNA glutamyl-Q(34) synthetase GluQRS n=1 Tax=Sphingopyxis bauzanensis TaxID=651663 RepID=A0A246JQ95_9SPHN|nr:tRNA glutamyl-Q(34) synthetase GluQRS [Sphingopyxis bauzanensis]OWQ94978.1 tRNA glutamyl-Q(34) synthetase GluQRS [Sphingopyxis bauzanensis]GGJ54551.1 tRNA glutamyl-Q(34) synthetase GluQRS [Sphingopyxis bauzanensis]
MLTRFAPSPTGDLHLGHGYSAVLAHDAARAAGGQYLIRFDDIDGSRSREEYVGASLADLAWLGLGWDSEPVRQSARLGDYAAALDMLRARNLVYPCFCTRADIAASLSAPHGPSGAVYPGTCRTLSKTEQQRRMAAEPHCWRLDMARAVTHVGALTWEEQGEGPRPADPLAHGDIVLARKDAPASYHLASTLDDAAMGVTHVTRGADLIAATDVHRLLQALLDLPTPLYRHHALVCGCDGKRLAKRDAAASLAALRGTGVDGRALAADLLAGRLPTGYSLQMP